MHLLAQPAILLSGLLLLLKPILAAVAAPGLPSSSPIPPPTSTSSAANPCATLPGPGCGCVMYFGATCENDPTYPFTGVFIKNGAAICVNGPSKGTKGGSYPFSGCAAAPTAPATINNAVTVYSQGGSISYNVIYTTSTAVGAAQLVCTSACPLPVITQSVGNFYQFAAVSGC